jgi:redox-sensitive bicupin YhaK (pirin superfamily)
MGAQPCYAPSAGLSCGDAVAVAARMVCNRAMHTFADSARRLQRAIAAQRTSDGAGVSLWRSLGQTPFARLDPFLMLDEFGSDKPGEYIKGFPPHPHRGFQTVTYMLAGHMLHEDHLGNRGHLRAGDVQWMNAGRGIIHSEMPQQESGLMRGFQLWINLPARDKMSPAGYQDIPAASLPVVEDGSGLRAVVVAGEWTQGGARVAGPVAGLATQPLFVDLSLPVGAALSLPLPATHNAFIYVYEGALSLPGGALVARHGGVLGAGDRIEAVAGDAGARCLLLAARPIGEPVVQYGPFVMNTREEIEQAVRDYQSGRLAVG